MLAEPRPRIVGVDNHLPDGRGRQALIKALEARFGRDAGRIRASGVRRRGRSSIEPQPPGVWRVGFGRAPAAWLATGEPQDFIGPFVLEKRHPLLLGITLGGVVWAGAVPLAAGAVRPLVSAGDQALVGMPDASAGSADRAGDPLQPRSRSHQSHPIARLADPDFEPRRDAAAEPARARTLELSRRRMGARASRARPEGTAALSLRRRRARPAGRPPAGVHRAVAGRTAADSRRAIAACCSSSA